MAIVENLRQSRYRTSGRLFRSYYPWICDVCGTPFNAAAIRRGHSKSECDDSVRWNNRLPRLWSAVAEIRTIKVLDSALSSATSRRQTNRSGR